MNEFSPPQEQKSDNRQVFMAGFHVDEIQALISHGFNVAAAIYIPGHGEAESLNGIELLRHHDAASCQLSADQRKDFDVELRTKLYDSSIQFFRRHHNRFAYERTRTLRSWINLDNLFHLAANCYFDILKRKKISDVVFANFPHDGSYIILYQLAHLMGLNVLVMNQSQFPNRIWISKTIEDFGRFETVGGGGEPLTLPERPTLPFYMKRTKPYRQAIANWATVLREGLKLSLKGLTLQMLYKRDAVDRNMSRFTQAADELAAGHPSGPNEVDVKFDRPFIYFPLHLQPEMTTDTWGGQYGDQLLALEELSAALGDDIDIYVKENPKQTHFMREDSFYRRLRTIPNTKYVASTVSSFELIQKCLCVASITGTVGWEALLMGRPVIHFGATWYAALPGAFHWEGPETLKQARACIFTRETLSEAFDALARKSYPGVIDEVYKAIVKDYDRPTHMGQAMASLAQALRAENERA